MKIKNLIRIPSIFLMAVLILSIPLMTASVEAKDAKSEAKKDAENIKELRWFAAGFLGGVLPFIPMCVLNVVDDIQGDDLYYISCCLLGVSPLLPTTYAIFHSPVPPVEQLLGKPPDYVSAYTDAYRNYAKVYRVGLSIAGCMAGVSIGAIVITLFPSPPDMYGSQ